jgi:hypothetical protein
MGLLLLLHSTHTSPDLAHRFMQGAVTMPKMPLSLTKSPTFTDHLQEMFRFRVGSVQIIPLYHASTIQRIDTHDDAEALLPEIGRRCGRTFYQITDLHADSSATRPSRPMVVEIIIKVAIVIVSLSLLLTY